MSKKNIILTNVIIFVFIVIVAVIIWLSGDWLYAGSRETFGPLNSYIFVWISILIASIAATNTVIASIMTRDSLRITEDSLELTRAIQRPFLNIDRATLFFGDPLRIRYEPPFFSLGGLTPEKT